MNARTVLGVSVLGLTLSACFGIPITESDFEWRYPVLSKSGCPDLTGAYNIGQPLSANAQRIGLIYLLTGGAGDDGVPTYKGVHHERIRALPRTWRTINNRGDVLEPTISESQAPKYRSKVEQQGDKIIVSLMDENGVLYSRGTFELDGKNFGCAEGQLVIKTSRNSVPPESWAQVLEYSETLVRKETDYSLAVMRMSTYKIRSLTIGQSFKAPQKATRTWKFERVEK